MNILDFNSVISDEHSYRLDMKEKREAQGIDVKSVPVAVITGFQPVISGNVQIVVFAIG